MQERALALRVGGLLIGAAIVLAAFVLFLGDIGFERGTRIQVDYTFSGAIQPGAPVRISGVKVGRVEDLVFLGGELKEDGDPILVRLVLFVQDRARPVLKEGARFHVNTQGLLGEHYVEIVPPRSPGKPLADMAIVRGVDPPRFDLLIQRLYDFLEVISRLLSGKEELIGDLVRAATELTRTVDGTLRENQTELAVAIKNAAVVTDEAVALLKSMNRAVGDGQKLASTVDNVEASTAVLKRDLPETMAHLKESLDRLARVAQALEGVDRAKVDTLLARTNEAMAHADQILGDAEAITRRVRAGGGTVGLLLQDDEIYDDLKEMLRDLKQHPWKLVWKQ